MRLALGRDRAGSGAQPATEQPEVGSALRGVEDDDLAIQDAPGRDLADRGLGDLGESRGQVHALPRPDPGGPGAPHDRGAVR